MTTVTKLAEILFEQMQDGASISDIIQTLSDHETKSQKRLEWLLNEDWVQREGSFELSVVNEDFEVWQNEFLQEIDTRIEKDQ